MNMGCNVNEQLREIISILLESKLYLELSLEERRNLIRSLLGDQEL